MIDRKIAMDKEQLKQEIKNAIDQVRYDDEEEINGKWYLDTTVLVGEIVTSNVIDRIVDKHIPEGAVVLSKEEYERLKQAEKLPKKMYKYLDRWLGTGKLCCNVLSDCARKYNIFGEENNDRKK